MREKGALPGLAINPGTSLALLDEALRVVDFVLVMTVNPGWGGQAFIPASLGKIARMRELIGPDADLEVDGGIDATTARTCAEAGATLFVAGTSVFGAKDPGVAYREIAAAAGA